MAWRRKVDKPLLEPMASVSLSGFFLQTPRWLLYTQYYNEAKIKLPLFYISVYVCKSPTIIQGIPPATLVIVKQMILVASKLPDKSSAY